MLEIRLEQRSLASLRTRLQEIAQHSADLDEAGVWQDVSDILSEELEMLFDKEGAHRGPRWTRLAPATIELRKKRKLTPIKIGWARGRMATSLIDPNTPYSVEIRKPLTFIRGTGAANEMVSYPSVFAGGRKGKQPARPIFGRLFRGGNTAVVDRIADAAAKRVFGP